MPLYCCSESGIITHSWQMICLLMAKFGKKFFLCKYFSMKFESSRTVAVLIVNILKQNVLCGIWFRACTELHLYLLRKVQLLFLCLWPVSLVWPRHWSEYEPRRCCSHPMKRRMRLLVISAKLLVSTLCVMLTSQCEKCSK